MWTPPRDPGRTSPGCATTSATRSSSPRPGRSRPASPASAGSPSCRRSSTPSSRPSPDRPVRAPDPAARPPLVAARRARPTSTGRHVVVTRRRHARGRSTRSGSSATARPGRMGVAIAEAALDRGARVTLVAGDVEVAAARPAPTVVRVESTADLRGAAALDAAIDGAPASTRWSWPPPSPTSGRAAAADTKLARGDGLTLELEPTAGPPRRGRGRRGSTARASRAAARPVLVGLRGRDRLARSGRRTSSAARAWTCSSPTTSPRPARGSGRTRTASRSSPRTARRDDLPLLSKREVADRILDRVARALDARDAARADWRHDHAAGDPA